MKKYLSLLVPVFLFSFLFSVSAQSVEPKTNTIDTAVFSMALHGAHCENIIHKRTPFEKGVIKVKADASTQTVKVVFQKNKTDVQKLIEHFKNIGFDAKLIIPEK